MRKPVIIVGAGGHAKVVVQALRRTQAEILGLVDTAPEKAGTQVMGVAVLGGDAVLTEYGPEKVSLAMGIAGNGSNALRRALFEKFKTDGYAFETIVDPTAAVGDEVTMGEGTQAIAGSIVQPAVRIGKNSIINTRASVDHDCRIGDHVHIAPGATVCGGVHLADGVFVGAGATLIANVRVGADTVIAAGAVVTEDLPSGVRARGVPAQYDLDDSA